MEWQELIVDGFDRLPELAEEALAGVRAADLDWPPRPGTNPLGWTVWHLTRVEDAQIADLMGEADLWTRDGWHAKFNRPPDHEDSGYGHTAAQVGAFRSPSAKVQLDYLRAATERTKQYLATLSPADLDRELDEPWYTPRPTVGVRLLEHPGGLPPARRGGVVHPRSPEGQGEVGPLGRPGRARPGRRHGRPLARNAAGDLRPSARARGRPWPRRTRSRREPRERSPTGCCPPPKSVAWPSEGVSSPRDRHG